MEEVKKKRGRPRKIMLPEEVLLTVQRILEESEPQTKPSKVIERKGEWDVTLNDEILFFDPTLSYELTGYKPISNTLGLDFKPEWFTEVRDTYKRTGHYTSLHPGTKAYNDFLKEEWKRCRDGLTVKGYTITGDHYFFLNYYQLMNVTKTEKAGGGRMIDFPSFLVALYEYFHYLELCKRTRKNAALMKARGLGFSEMNASLIANMYSVRRSSMSIIAAQREGKLIPTLRKIWLELSFLNDKTDGIFFKLSQVLNKQDNKRASHYKIINGQLVEEGFMSEIRGIVADTPDKIRGDRADMLIYEEAGSWPKLKTAVIQGQALINILGDLFGITIVGGTGGDTGPALEGLRDIYYNPTVYNVLPLKHHFTEDGQEVYTGYFLPTYSIVLQPGYIDDRGFTDPIKGRIFHLKLRDLKLSDPKGLPIYKAEYCFTAEEAFAMEGENKFNKVLLTELLSKIKLYKLGPKIKHGDFKFIYKKGKTELRDVERVLWIEDNNGLVEIIEPPLWESPFIDENGNTVTYKVMNDLYIAGVDSIDIGNEDTSDATKDPSKFCIVIKKRAFGTLEPMYVAKYLFRPEDIRSAYRTALALLIYYNCRVNVEATRLSFIHWMKGLGYGHMLLNRPRATYADLSKKRKPTIGTPATVAVIAHQTDLIADYIEDFSDTIWFEDMLDLFLRYSDENKGKFDIVAAVAMAELADEEYRGIIPRDTEVETESVWKDVGYYRDTYGRVKWGVIPKEIIPKYNMDFNRENDDPRRIRTSNPRYNTENIL